MFTIFINSDRQASSFIENTQWGTYDTFYGHTPRLIRKGTKLSKNIYVFWVEIASIEKTNEYLHKVGINWIYLFS